MLLFVQILLNLVRLSIKLPVCVIKMIFFFLSLTHSEKMKPQFSNDLHRYQLPVPLSIQKLERLIVYRAHSRIST